MDKEHYRTHYLRSPHWKATAKAKREEGYNLCERCGASGCHDVHHVTYQRLGNERSTDLQLLCRSCHSQEHPSMSWDAIRQWLQRPALA